MVKKDKKKIVKKRVLKQKQKQTQIVNVNITQPVKKSRRAPTPRQQVQPAVQRIFRMNEPAPPLQSVGAVGAAVREPLKHKEDYSQLAGLGVSEEQRRRALVKQQELDMNNMERLLPKRFEDELFDATKSAMDRMEQGNAEMKMEGRGSARRGRPKQPPKTEEELAEIRRERNRRQRERRAMKKMEIKREK